MPLHLFFGDNHLEIDDALDELRRPFETADVLNFEGALVPVSTLSEACLTAGLFDPHRLVIVRDLHLRIRVGQKEGGETEELARVIASVSPTTTLVLLDKDIAGDHQLVQMVRGEGGEVRSFSTPKKYDLPRWLIGRARQRNVVVEHSAAELLVDLVGANTLALESELDKLTTYAGPGERLTPAMVEELVGAVTQDSIFALVDAIAAGNEAKALRLLHAQLDRTSSGPVDFALYLIRMLARQMRILLRIKVGKESGRSNSQLVAELKLARYYTDRYFNQANRLSKERLIGSFELLAALEHALKQGKAEPFSGLDLLVAELSAAEPATSSLSR
jgi:DNA polymerase III subunit delta